MQVFDRTLNISHLFLIWFDLFYNICEFSKYIYDSNNVRLYSLCTFALSVYLELRRS